MQSKIDIDKQNYLDLSRLIKYHENHPDITIDLFTN